MRILLDTNIIIHREASRVIRPDIGTLFNWLDRLHFTKCIHPLTIQEIRKHKDPKVVSTFEIKLKSYEELRTLAPESPEIEAIRKRDTDDNSKNDTTLIKEVFARRVNVLITEDRDLHDKAHLLGIDDYVFTIDGFLEKVTAENPDLTTYKVLGVKQELFGNISLADPFFDSLKRDYPDFADWFNRKADASAYVCRADSGSLLAFLFLKVEDEREPYHEINPTFSPKRRLKIGTFKVASNGFKLGERFLKIAFDNALQAKVSEIYLTIFNKDSEHDRLIALLRDWGFKQYGVKRSPAGEELVLVRDFTPRADRANPATTYPFMSKGGRKLIVPIYPAYHTELLPDSILRTESPRDFVENKPNRNAIRKVYISRSINRDLAIGDIIIFYRTAFNGPAHYTSVATTLGVVEGITTRIDNEERFLSLCRKRSVFSDEDLKKHWNYVPGNRPFVVNFLYNYSLPKRPNLAKLREENIITEAPRGFEQISNQAFSRLCELSNADSRLVVD